MKLSFTKRQWATALMLGLGATANAQINFTESTGTPFAGLQGSSITVADVDADGDQDVFLTGSDLFGYTSSILYTNDGNGVFSEVIGAPFEGVEMGDAAFADVDGDNDLDLFVMGRDGSMQAISTLYTNDGFGVFTEVVGTPFDAGVGGAVAFADVDGDNDQDLLITGRNNSSQNIANLYTNDGSGVFTLVTTTPFVGVDQNALAFADVDGDNDQDVLISGRNASLNTVSTLYANDGAGVFTEVMGTPFVGAPYGTVSFEDVDGDTDMDAIITGVNSSSQSISILYSNDGTGNYTEVMDSLYSDLSIKSTAFADVDGDNDVDVIVAGFDNSFQSIAKLYTNDGLGAFTEVAGMPFGGSSSGTVVFADVNGDNEQDVLISGIINVNDILTTLYLNTSTVGIATVEQTTFSLYPNPNKGQFRLQSDAIGAVVEIKSIDGKLVKSMTIQKTVEEVALNVEPGIYLVSITQENTQHVQRIVVN